MDAEDVEAWIPFSGIVGGILTIELQEEQEEDLAGSGRMEDQEEDREEALMEQRRGTLLVPLVAIIFAIAFTSNNCSRTSP